MSVAKVIELTGSSKKGSDHAIRKLVKRANRTVTNIQSVWVKDIKADVVDGQVARWRVTCKVTFLLQ